MIDCAAEMDLPPAKKLTLLCFSDSADKVTRIAVPGQDRVLTWSGVKRARAMELINELISDGLLERKSPGRKGHMAEFWVFPDGCCPLHGPLSHRSSSSEAPAQQTLSGDEDEAGSTKGSTKGSTPEWTPPVSPYLPVVDGANAPSTTPPQGTEIEIAVPPSQPARRSPGDLKTEARHTTQDWRDWINKSGLVSTQRFEAVMGIVKTCLGNGVPRNDIAFALAALTHRAEVVTAQSMARALSDLQGRRAFRNPDDQARSERNADRAQQLDTAERSAW